MTCIRSNIPSVAIQPVIDRLLAKLSRGVDPSCAIPYALNFTSSGFSTFTPVQISCICIGDDIPNNSQSLHEGYSQRVVQNALAIIRHSALGLVFKLGQSRSSLVGVSPDELATQYSRVKSNLIEPHEPRDGISTIDPGPSQTIIYSS